MAHEITKDDDLILVGEPAWHRLGIQVPREAGLGVREWFRRVIPWNPMLVPIYQGGGEPVPDAIGVVRHQQGKPDKYLATVNAKYSLITHEQMIDIAEAAENAHPDVKLETVGSTHGGRRIFCLLRVGKYGIGLNKEDTVSTYLALLNSFDGSTSLRGFGSEVRIVCANTYAAALGAADGSRVGFRINHAGDTMERIEAARAAVALGRLEGARLEEEASAMADRPMGIREVGEYFAKVSSILYPAVAMEKPADAKEAAAWERQRERARQLVTTWVTEIEHERQQLVSGTAYAAYSAVSHWCDHSRTRVREHAHDMLFGRGAAIKQQARKLALTI